MKLNHKFYPVAAAILASLIFAFMGVWIRMMSQSFTNAQQVLWRIIVAAAIAWIFFGHEFSKKVFARLTHHDYLIYIVRGALNYGVGVMLFTVAVNNAPLATVSFIASLPIMGVLAWIMFRERFDGRAVPFVLLSIVGLILLAGVSIHSLKLGFGETAAIVSVLGLDISFLMVRYHPKSMTNLQNTTLLLSFAWIVPLAYILIMGQAVIPHTVSAKAMVALFTSAAFNVLNLYLLNYIFTHLKAYVAGNILLLEGVFALAIGYVIYGETIGIVRLAGALIIIVCAVAIARVHSSKPAIRT